MALASITSYSSMALEANLFGHPSYTT